MKYNGKRQRTESLLVEVQGSSAGRGQGCLLELPGKSVESVLELSFSLASSSFLQIAGQDWFLGALSQPVSSFSAFLGLNPAFPLLTFTGLGEWK